MLSYQRWDFNEIGGDEHHDDRKEENNGKSIRKRMPKKDRVWTMGLDTHLAAAS